MFVIIEVPWRRIARLRLPLETRGPCDLHHVRCTSQRTVTMTQHFLENPRCVTWGLVAARGHRANHGYASRAMVILTWCNLFLTPSSCRRFDYCRRYEGPGKCGGVRFRLFPARTDEHSGSISRIVVFPLPTTLSTFVITRRWPCNTFAL